MFKRFILILILLSSFAFAQDLDSLLAVLEERQQDEQWLDLVTGKANYHIFFLQAGYNSESYFEGRDVGLDQANMSLSATYSFKQFSLTYAGIIYEALYPALQTSVVSLDYELPLAIPIDISLNAGRFLFHDPEDTLGNLYPNSLGVSVGKDLKFFGASLDAGCLVGSGGIMPQVLASLYGDLELYRFNDKTNLHVRPALSFSFGSELTARTIVPGEVLGKNNGQGNGPGNGPGPGQDPTTPETVYSTEFGLLNSELDLYLTLNMGDFMLSLGIQSNHPRSMQDDLDYAPTTMISLTGGYAFSFIK
jgi:hypothetical protein